MRFEVHSYQLPRWMVPVLVLAALALIPFALVLALGVATLAIGVSVLRVLLPPAGGVEKPETFERSERTPLKPGITLDADFEIKDENEKEQRH